MSVFLFYGQRFPRQWLIFKNAIFGHETCMFDHWPKFQQWHIYSLSPRDSKLTSFSLCRQRFLRYWLTFKTVIFRHEIPEVAHILSFFSKGLKLSLFLLYGQRFPKYGPIFKIDIFGQKKLGKWPTFQKLHIRSLSTPSGRN